MSESLRVEEFIQNHAVINCRTKEEAEQLSVILIKAKREWKGDSTPSIKDNMFWEDFSENTCYQLDDNYKLTYGSIQMFKEMERTDIYTFDMLKVDESSNFHIFGGVLV